MNTYRERRYDIDYGIQHLWVQTETWGPVYKTIYDKAGEYWKTLIVEGRCFESQDKGFHHVDAGDQSIVDERSNHATVFRGPMPTDLWQYDTEREEHDFSLAGFQEFCK